MPGVKQQVEKIIVIAPIIKSKVQPEPAIATPPMMYLHTT